MRTVNIHEAKTHLSRLLEAVAAGEEIIIAKAGRPVAKVVPVDVPERVAKPRMGFMPDISVPDDFDEMFADEIAEMFGTKN